VTLPNNFVTVFHTLNTDLGIETPWPKPADYVPKNAEEAILIWGAASSVGQYAVQILRYYGYTNIFATASEKHHARLRSFGAKWTFDYKDKNVVSSIVDAAAQAEKKTGVPLILDCIGSKDGSIGPIAKIAKTGAKVAILLPVVVKDSSETEDPEYEMDVTKAAEWDEGVDARGVRTHFYADVSIQSSVLPKVVS
jgi:NADPH:quinone reductase-like Zn-dependent oxidoreductase